MRDPTIQFEQFGGVDEGTLRFTGYGLEGAEVEPGGPACLAKLGSNPVTGRTSYWVRRLSYSGAAGSLFNPYDSQEGSRFLQNATGKELAEFVRCSKECFEAYLAFLLTQNTVNLRIAERL